MARRRVRGRRHRPPARKRYDADRVAVGYELAVPATSWNRPANDCRSSTSTSSPSGADEAGTVSAFGVLLRVTQGQISRALVSGRVLYHERIRTALLRHIEKDLGPLALPKLPASPQPFTVAEYFPTPGVTAFHDPRQHAVSLAYVVPIEGDCEPQQDALELTWFAPAEAADATLAGRDGRWAGDVAAAGARALRLLESALLTVTEPSQACRGRTDPRRSGRSR